MDKIVSIIIPVYNTPLEYLEACFTSVRMQKYPLLEPIVVDDGSDELTAKLLERICGQEFKILHKKNGGLSDARNFGIARCSGDYVYLLDSDDELAFDGAIESFVAAAEGSNADIVVGAYHYEGVASGPCYPESGPDWLVDCLRAGVSFSAADQLYSRALLSRMDGLFRVGLVHEDEEFTPRALMESHLVVGLPGTKTYARSEREGSLTKSASAKSCFKRCEGKLIVARDSLSNDGFSLNQTLRTLMDERAFSFVNMALRAWAENLCGTEYERTLQDLAEQVDYSRSRFSVRTTRSLRNWFCMALLRLVGVPNYVALLRRTLR